MSRPEQEFFSLSIVVLGNFSPRIFQPEWFVNKKLIREAEVEPENLKVVHPDLTIIETDEFKLEVRPNRFELQTFQESYREPLKDLISSIFRLLSETPITAFGINYNKHFKFEIEKDYLNFGFHLAPINKTFDFMDNPRLLDITITDRKSIDLNLPTTNIRIYPSDLIPYFGVAININTHYNKVMDGAGFYEFISEIWDSILEISENKIKDIWNRY